MTPLPLSISSFSGGRFGMKVVRDVAAFLVIGALLLGLAQTVFVEKDSYPKYRAWKAAEDVDVLVLGNSHAENGIRAGALSDSLSESAGREVTVFNYAIYGMRMEQMYYFVKEIFRTHVPDLIVLETYAFCPLADGDREILEPSVGGAGLWLWGPVQRGPCERKRRG